MDNFADPSKLEEFKLLQLEGKHLASIGDLRASLHKFELAKQICPTPKVLQRIEKLKACLKIGGDSDKTQLLPHLSSTSSVSELHTKSPTVKQASDKSAVDLQISNKRKSESKILSDIQNIQKDQKFSERRSDSSDLSPESLLKFKQLKNEAKQLALDGKYSEAVSYFKNALCVYDCPKVKRYIKEIESVKSCGRINENSEELVKDEFQKPKFSVVSVEVSVEQSSSSANDDESDNQRKLDEVKIIYEEARELAASGKLTEALKLLKEAQSIHETQKVQKRIKKLEEIIAAEVNNPEEDKWVEVTKGFSVYHEIYNMLYPYQREGVAWMWNLYKIGKGGVLGDDMGLGKTFQVIAFISGMIDADLVNHVLIIMPVSLLKNWEKEFKKWCPGISVYDFHSGTKKERERNKLKVQRRGHVLLTSYGMIVSNVNLLTEMDGSEFVWDYVILDEGHKIKNPTKTTKAVYEIPAKNRLVLTGTPIQNNLKELWSLFDFVHQGTLLGSLKTFKLQYETPITRSREKNATAGEKRLGSEMAENLKALIKPYFLRRTKDEVWKKKDEKDVDIENLEARMEKMNITQLNAKKNDLILWTFMSEQQISIYKDFLHSDAVKSILVSKRSPLVELTTLKKICDHPRLLSQRACFHLGLNGELQHADELDLDDESTLASSIANVTDECLIKESGKLKLVIDLLEHLKETGHRTLVFSLSRKILDMIHRILVNKNWKVMRLDGTITKTIDREKRIMIFQKDPSYPVFLLTTQVGGVGITLTAADRVIIYDPSWNPATDAQAVDRAYRIGQEKNVVVYRLITCGTVEEKIYRRQIFKDSITRQATGENDPFRYFSKQELRELFSLGDPWYSATQVQLHGMHSSQRSTYNELDKHLQFLRSLNIFGISDHDLMFSKQVEDNAEDNDPNAISEHFIKQKVAAAHAQIQMEANVVAEGIRLAGTFNRPYQETIPLSKKNLIKDLYKPPTLPDIIDLTEDAQNTVFTSNLVERNSFTAKTSIDDDDDIQIVSPKPKNESVLNEVKLLSLADNEVEKILPQRKSHKLSLTVSEPKDFNEIFNRSAEIAKTEKLRKSLVQDKFDDQELYIDPNVDDANLDETCVKSVKKQSFTDDVEQEPPPEIKPLDVTCDLKEKFQANLTHYMNDDIANFSFDEQAPAVTVKKGRKSCARKSLMLESESDSSCQNSASNSLNVDESEGIDSDDSSNSASISFVPESSTNTPQTSHSIKSNESIYNSISKTPLYIEPELLSGKNSPALDLKKVEGSVRRITPLKIDDKIPVREDLSFVQAMANSLIITPESSPKNEQIHIETDISKHLSSDEEASNSSPRSSPKSKLMQVVSNTSHACADDDDSPLKIVKKKNIKQIISDSEESDTDTKNMNCSNEDDCSFQRHSESLSHEEEEKNDSDNEEQDERSLESSLESLSESQEDDLEQTFATCKDKTESNSEDDQFSEDSEEDYSSDESGSLFSEED